MCSTTDYSVFALKICWVSRFFWYGNVLQKCCSQIEIHQGTNSRFETSFFLDHPGSYFSVLGVVKVDMMNVLMRPQATHRESMSYGCVVEDSRTHEATHYVEKPETFVSSLINCGLYVFSPGVVKNFLAELFDQHQAERYAVVTYRLEHGLFFHTDNSCCLFHLYCRNE